MDERLIARIERDCGMPGLVDALTDRLPASDLQSLLLEVYRRRVERLSPAAVLERYQRDTFVCPAPLDPAALAAFDLETFAVLGRLGYDALELSPLSPLGTVAAVATVHQNNVLTTSRSTEVVADSTNVLALEAAVRRRALLRLDARDSARVRLCASHRLVRGQRFEGPGRRQHFRLLGLATAGRDEGSFRFETSSLLELLTALLRVLERAGESGYRFADVQVTVTDLTGGRRQDLRDFVLEPLAVEFPGVDAGFDDDREGGRGYYTGACFHIDATTEDGDRVQVGDGGFTTWTTQLLGNAKERLLIGSLGTERLCGLFRTTGTG